jgi:hypothetical protein
MRPNKLIKYVTALCTCMGKWKTQLDVFLSSPVDSTEWSSLMLQLWKYCLCHPVHRRVGKLQILTWYVIERNFCPCWEMHPHHPGDQQSIQLPGLPWLQKDNREKYCKILCTHTLNIFCIQILYTDIVKNNAYFI